jgi:hypothetical protein
VQAVKGEQSLLVAGGTPLRLHAPDSSGLRDTGWDKADFEITAFKVARDAATLSRISVSAPKGGRLRLGRRRGRGRCLLLRESAEGRGSRPHGRERADDPPGLDGTVSARLENGPPSLSGGHGTVDVDGTNGPVSFRNASGEWTFKVANGPLSARLAGTGWDGKGLVAVTVNGPLTVSLDPRFVSGLRVSSSTHAPFHCRAAACAGSRRFIGDEDGHGEQAVEIGAGAEEQGPLLAGLRSSGPRRFLEDHSPGNVNCRSR